jgi:hypothetical protein
VAITRSTPPGTIVETNILTRPDLSFTAKGIYAYLCTLPLDTPITEQMLYALPGPGAMSSVYGAGLNELIKAGIINDVPDV